MIKQYARETQYAMLELLQKTIMSVRELENGLYDKDDECGTHPVEPDQNFLAMLDQVVADVQRVMDYARDDIRKRDHGVVRD